MTKTKKPLTIGAKIIDDGLSISVDNKNFEINWPKKIWQKTPQTVKAALRENLTYATTNFLPLILDKEKIIYKTPQPLLETFVFKNQLYDVLDSEWQDNKKPLTYLKPFYNTEIVFNSRSSTIPVLKKVKKTNQKPKAIIPFTFGKESLTTFALCLELGIEPILVYCQEPAHPHEEKTKKKMLAEFEKEYGIKTYFIKNETGLFRYGKAFNKKVGTEIGWAAQTTILALMSVPFALFHQADYVFFGSENSNNSFEIVQGWKVFCSYDQTSNWTPQQNNMIRLMTNDQVGVYSILEPLEELNILFLLANRYPKLTKWLFSCGSKNPLLKNSHWCHRCDKCERIFAFAQSLEINPEKFGFKKDLGKQKNFLQCHLKNSGDIDLDLEFALMILQKKKISWDALKKFSNPKIKKFQTYNQHRKHYTNLMPFKNLPAKYEKRLIKIFKEELNDLKKILPTKK